MLHKMITMILSNRNTLLGVTDLQFYIAFYEAAGINKFHSRKRKDISRTYGNEFGSFIISSCQYDNWWYANFIGISFLGIIVRNYATREVREVIPVLITGTTIQLWRSLDPKDVSLI